MSRPPADAGPSADDRRIREYVAAPGGISESAASLADKLGVSRRRCRRVLEDLTRQGVVRRHDFSNIAPMYCRFPTLSRPPATEAPVSGSAAYTEPSEAAVPTNTARAFGDSEQAQRAPSPAW